MFSPFESPPDLQATLSGLNGGNNAVEDTPVKVASISDAGTTNVSPADPNVTYQWQISADRNTWTNIVGATASSYDPTAADLDMHLRVEIFYVENEGGGTEIDTVTNRLASFRKPPKLSLRAAIGSRDRPGLATRCRPQLRMRWSRPMWAWR